MRAKHKPGYRKKPVVYHGPPHDPSVLPKVITAEEFPDIQAGLEKIYARGKR